MGSNFSEASGNIGGLVGGGISHPRSRARSPSNPNRPSVAGTSSARYLGNLAWKLLPLILSTDPSHCALIYVRRTFFTGSAIEASVNVNAVLLLILAVHRPGGIPQRSRAVRHSARHGQQPSLSSLCRALVWQPRRWDVGASAARATLQLGSARVLSAPSNLNKQHASHDAMDIPSGDRDSGVNSGQPQDRLLWLMPPGQFAQRCREDRTEDGAGNKGWSWGKALL